MSHFHVNKAGVFRCVWRIKSVAAAYLVELIRDGDACEKEKTTLSTKKE